MGLWTAGRPDGWDNAAGALPSLPVRPVLVGTLMDSTLRVPRPWRHPRTDLARGSRWGDWSLFSSELGLFPEEETKPSL